MELKDESVKTHLANLGPLAFIPEAWNHPGHAHGSMETSGSCTWQQWSAMTEKIIQETIWWITKVRRNRRQRPVRVRKLSWFSQWAIMRV